MSDLQIENFGGVGAAWLDKKLQAYFAAPANYFLGIAYYGDSIAAGIGGQFGTLLENFTIPAGARNTGGGQTNVVGYNEGIGAGTTGAVVNYGKNPIVSQDHNAGNPGEADFTFLPSADHLDMADGATITLDWSQANGFSTIRIYLATGPDMGSALVELINRDTAAVVDSTTVNLSAATIGATKAQFAATAGTKYKARITATGRVVFLKAGAFFASGLLKVSLYRGGSRLSQNNYSNAAILEYFRQELNLACIFLQCKEEGLPDTATTTLQRLTALPGVSVICSGNGLPQSSGATKEGTAALRAVNAIWRIASETYGALFYDVFELFGGSYAKLSALGWAGDGTHPSGEANMFAARLLAAALGLPLFPSRTLFQSIINASVSTALLRLKRADGTPDYFDVIVPYGGSAPNQAIIKNLKQIFLGDPAVQAVGLTSYGTASVLAVDKDGNAAPVYAKQINAVGAGLTNSISGHLVLGGNFYFGSTSGLSIRIKAGSPEGSLDAPVGTICLRSDGGPGSTLYVKESGTGNTGWVAK